MPRIELALEITAPVAVVFDLARNIDVHLVSQAAHRERVVTGRISGLIEEGEEVTWEAVHFGVRQRLTNRIVSMTRPVHFRDSMVSGVFKRFDHDHFFEARSDGRTLMREVFDYTPPFGVLGEIVDMLLVERYLQRLFAERNAVIKRLAEDPLHRAVTSTSDGTKLILPEGDRPHAGAAQKGRSASLV